VNTPTPKVADLHSLIIAEKAGRAHFTILRNFSGGPNSKPFLQEFLTDNEIIVSEYTDSTGRKLPYYELTEQQALTVLPFIAD